MTSQVVPSQVRIVFDTASFIKAVRSPAARRERSCGKSFLEWIRNRKQPSKELSAAALALLDRAGTQPTDPDDQLPGGDRKAR